MPAGAAGGVTGGRPAVGLCARHGARLGCTARRVRVGSRRRRGPRCATWQPPAEKPPFEELTSGSCTVLLWSCLMPLRADHMALGSAVKTHHDSPARERLQVAPSLTTRCSWATSRRSPPTSSAPAARRAACRRRRVRLVQIMHSTCSLIDAATSCSADFLQRPTSVGVSALHPRCCPLPTCDADFQAAVVEDMAGRLRRQVAEHADWLSANCDRQVRLRILQRLSQLCSLTGVARIWKPARCSCGRR